MADNMSMSNSINESFNLQQYVVSYMGTRRIWGLSESVAVTIVYSIILVTGVVGNVFTCVVIRRNAYMHTATNYYLFSLATSDVLTLVWGLPPEMYTIWQAYPWEFGEAFCVFKTFLSELTSSASVLTITAFTAERYVAICHPIRAQTMSSLSRAVKIIIVIWIIACIITLPYPIHARTFYYLEHPVTKQPIADSLMCNILPEWLPNMKYMFQVSTFLLFVAPMVIISVLYVLIGLTLRKSSMARRTSDKLTSSPTGPSQARKSVLKMLVAVVIAFFICWAPFHAQRLMTVFIKDNDWTPTLINIQNVLFYISGVLYFVSSTVNPILYNLMSKKYRKAFKDTLCKCCLSKEQRNMRDYRGRPIPSGTTAYVTVSNSSNSRSNIPHDGSHFQRSPAIRRAFQPPPLQHTSKANGSSKHKINSIKIKLFPSSNKNSVPITADSSNLDGNKSKLKTPNGSIESDTSRSPSSSPRLTHVEHLKGEVELNDIPEQKPSTGQQPILPKTDLITIDNRHNSSADTML